MSGVIQKVKNGLQVCQEFGVESFFKRVDNKKYHRVPDLETIRSVHLVSEEELSLQRQQEFSNPVKFSIITPLYNTPEQFLTELLDSLEQQTYGNWELCLADGSDQEHAYVGEICRERAKKDERIRYHVLEENKGISENTNACIELATGDYFGLLDHDDVLHPSALYEVMRAVEEQGAEFLYTDEVKFSGNIPDISNPLMFNLKPGFGKDDLRSHNYICHFTVFSRKLLEGEEKFYRKECDGSQDHDMVLRLTEKTDAIVHIPKVLYYWRVHENSVSQNLDGKIYAVDSAIRAIDQQLERTGEAGKAASNLPFQTIYRITYELKGNPLVSILLHHGGKEKIKEAVNNIRKCTSYENLEFVYFSDELLDLGSGNIRQVPVKTEAGASTADQWNRAVKAAHGEYLLLLDSVCRPLTENWIEELLMFAQREDVCAVGPKIYYHDDTIAYAGISLGEDTKDGLELLCAHDTRADIGYEGLLCHARETTAAAAACMMFSRESWKENEGFRSACPGYEDIDFCLRGQKAGKNNVWTCFAQMRYQGKHLVPPKSAGQSETFKSTWKESFHKEQYYHKLWKKLRIV